MRNFWFLIIPLLFSACRVMRTETIYTAALTKPVSYYKVAVVVINEDSVRSKMEKSFVSELNKEGVSVISSYQVFGAKSFVNLDMESSYLKLCDEGVDAILTLVYLTDKDLEMHNTGLGRKYINSFYMNRIWNYKKLPERSLNKNGYWESILFDLPTLEPHFVGRTHTRNRAGLTDTTELVRSIMLSMRKENIMSPVKTNIQKAF